MSESRKKLGWEMPEFGNAEYVVLPENNWKKEVRNYVIGNYDIHIFNGVYLFPKIRYAIKLAGNYNIPYGVITEAYHNPYILAAVDKEIYKDKNASIKSREEIIEQMCEYIDSEQKKGVVLHSMTRHILGLFQGRRGAKSWRRYLSEHGHREGADSRVVKKALQQIV
jgi:tRNA-dihydrouridine synthase